MFEDSEKIPNRIIFDTIEIRKFKDGSSIHKSKTKNGGDFIQFIGCEYTSYCWLFSAFDETAEKIVKMNLTQGCKVRILGSIKVELKTEDGKAKTNIFCKVEEIYLRSRPQDERQQKESVPAMEKQGEPAEHASSIPADMFLTMPKKHFG